MKRLIEKIQDKLQDVLLPLASKLNSEPHLSALKNGMTITIPLMIIGGFAMLLAVPPVPAGTTNSILLAWLNFSATYKSPLMALYNLSIGAISVYVVFGVSGALAVEYKLNKMTTSIIALFLFWLTAAEPFGLEGIGQVSSMTFLGAQGMFYAIIVSFITCEVIKFFMLKNIKIKCRIKFPQMLLHLLRH